MPSATSDANPLNHVIHKIIVLATGIPGSEGIRQYLETLYESNGDWSEVAVVIDNYLNGLLANASDGIPGMIQQLAENGFGASITLADAQALTAQFAEAGISTWSGLFAWLYNNVEGDLSTAWDNRAESASNFTATLNELGKNDDYNGKQVQAAAREWMEGVGVSDASVQAANDAATKLIERFLDGKVKGSAIDGYVAGATVFIDVNNNGEQDEGEPVTTTDASGNFTFDIDELPDGPLIGFGGTDLATGQPFEGEMTAPSGAAVLSPLTTLVQQMMTSNPGRSQAEVEDILFATLDLPRVDLSSFDPIQSSLEEGSTRESQIVAARIQAVTSQLVNAMNVSKAVNSKVSADADGSKGFISALAERLDEAAGNGDVVRLDDEAELTEVVKKSVEKSGAINENSTAEERERADSLSGKAAAAIRDVNVKSREAVDDLENNDDTDIVDALSDVFKLQTLTQTQVAPSFLESDDEGLDDVVDRFSGDNLDNEVEDVQAGKLDEDTDTSTGNVTRPDDAPTPTTPTPTISLSEDTGHSDSDLITSNPELTLDNLVQPYNWEYSQDGGCNWTDGSGNKLYLKASGETTVIVRQSDPSIGDTASASFTFTVDRTDPSRVSLSLDNDTGNGSDLISSETAINVTGLEDDAQWQYRLGSTGEWLDGSGNQVDITDEGQTTVSVRQIDVAGNESLQQSITVTRDTTAPSVPSLSFTDTGSSASDALTNNDRINVTGLELSSTTEYSLDGGSTWTGIQQFGCGTGHFDITADGEADILVRQTDQAGNVSDNASLNLTLDKTAPDAPSLSLATDTGSSTSDAVSTDTTVEVSGIDRGNTWEYSINGGSSWQDGSGSISISNDGTYNVQVRQTDDAGNVSSVGSLSVTRDTAEPVAPSLLLTEDTGVSGSDGLTSNGTVKVGALESGASWEYSLDGGSSWNAGCGNSFTASDNGELAVRVRQTDVAGNTSSAGSLDFTLDTEAPAATSLALSQDSGASASDKITNVGTVIVTNQESRATIEYSTDGSTWQSGCGNGFALSGDGERTVRVRQVDEAGNASTETSFLFTLDTSAPDAPSLQLAEDTGTSQSDLLTNNNQINVSGLEDSATWEYSIDGSTWHAGSGSSFNLDESDGTYTIQVRQTDSAGNVSSAGKLTSVTLDTSSPHAASSTYIVDTGASNSDAITNNSRVVVTGIDASSVLQYSTDSGETWESVNVTASTGTSYFDVTGDGEKNLLIRQVDMAGNANDPVSLDFTLDTLAPDAPSQQLSEDTGASDSDAITSNSVIVVSGIESNATWQYSTDGGCHWQSGSGNTVDLVNDDKYTVLVRQTDLAGNQSTNSSMKVTVDKTATAAPSLSLATDQSVNPSFLVTNDRTINVGGLELDSTWEYSMDGSTWHAGSGNSFETTGADGDRVVLVRQKDLAGNVSDDAALSFRLDTQAPAEASSTYINDNGISGSDSITSDPRVLVSGIESGSKLEYSTDAGDTWQTGCTYASCDGTWNGTIAVSGDGEKTVLVRQTDQAGNSNNPVSLSFTLDTTAPDAPSVALHSDSGNPSDNITTNGSVDVSGIDDESIWEYKLSTASQWQAGSGSTLDFSSLNDGEYIVQVRQTDVAGNQSSVGSLAFEVDTVDPASAPTALVLASDSGLNGSDRVTNDRTINVQGLDENEGWEYKVGSDGDWQAGSGSSFEATGEDGGKVVYVRHVDGAGNTSPEVSTSFTLDTTAPSQPTSAGLRNDSGSSNSDTVTFDGIIQVTGSGDNFNTQYSLDEGVSWNDASTYFYACDGTWISNIYVSGEGDKNVLIRQVDYAGNTNETVSVSMTIDTTRPSAPSLSLHSSNDYVLVSGLEENATWQYAFTASGAGGWTDGSGSSFQVSDAGEEDTVYIRQVDLAGNAGTAQSINMPAEAITTIINSNSGEYQGTSGDDVFIVTTTLERGWIANVIIYGNGGKDTVIINAEFDASDGMSMNNFTNYFVDIEKITFPNYTNISVFPISAYQVEKMTDTRNHLEIGFIDTQTATTIRDYLVDNDGWSTSQSSQSDVTLVGVVGDSSSWTLYQAAPV